MTTPTRGQWILLGLVAVCGVSLLPVVDAYGVGTALAGVVIAGLLYRQLGTRKPAALDDARPHIPVAGKRPAMLESTHEWLMTLRPMSQPVRFYVIPEIERRVATGVFREEDLPFQLVQFRWIQGGGKNIIELNEEVELRAKVKTRRPVEAGEPLSLSDIDPNESYLLGPVVDGRPAAFFLSRSMFLNFMNVFDFTPNVPVGVAEESSSLPGLRYPFAAIAQAEAALKAMRPIEKYRQLCDANWPPGPAYYPQVLWKVHSDPGSLGQPNFAETVVQSYSKKYLEERLDFWRETKFFGDRFVYVKKSIDEYLEGDYISSIYVLVPQFEGIIKDYLTGAAGEYRAQVHRPA